MCYWAINCFPTKLWSVSSEVLQVCNSVFLILVWICLIFVPYEGSLDSSQQIKVTPVNREAINFSCSCRDGSVCLTLLATLLVMLLHVIRIWTMSGLVVCQYTIMFTLYVLV